MTTTLSRVGDILELERIPVDIDPDEEYVQIGIRSFGKGIFHRDRCLGIDLGKLRYFKIQSDRLIVSNIMAWEGAIAVSEGSDLACVGSNRFLSYMKIGDVDLRYLNYYFQSETGRELIRGASTGTVTRNQTLSVKDFENLQIRLPPFPIQRHVSEKLDTALGCLTGVENLRNHMMRTRAALHESLIHSTQSSATNRVRMGAVVVLSRTAIDIDPDGQYRPVGMRSFGKGMIRYPSRHGSDLSKLNYFTFPARALALSNIKAWEGAIGVTADDESAYVASNRFLFYLPIDNQVNISYLRHYLLARQGLSQISACSPGAADRNRTLGVKRFENIALDLPPRESQDRVAAILDALDERLAAYSEETLAAVRPALLNAAFTGQL